MYSYIYFFEWLPIIFSLLRRQWSVCVVNAKFGILYDFISIKSSSMSSRENTVGDRQSPLEAVVSRAMVNFNQTAH